MTGFWRLANVEEDSPKSMQNSFPAQGLRLALFLGVSMAASLLMASGQRVQAQASVSLDVNGDGVAEFVNTTSTSSFPKDTGIGAFVRTLDSLHAENAILPMAVGGAVGATTPWEPGAISTSAGFYAIRFWTAAGIHYGWLETYNPMFGGRPAFVTGGWTKRAYINPEPNQPITVGDESLVLRAQMNPATGRLKIQWNTNASDLAGGIRIQRRSLQSGSTWTPVQTVTTGFEAEVPLSAGAMVYRVVR